MAEDERLSAYELERLETIRRNEQYLEELGLLSLARDVWGASNAKRALADAARKHTRKARVEDDPATSPRRSLRLLAAQNKSLAASIEHVQWDGDDDIDDTGKECQQRAAKRKRSPCARAGTPIALDPASARALDANFAYFISNEKLGTLLSDLNFGKAAVMALSNSGKTPKFSKYSGVAEWRNCVYLWVNITGHDGSAYNNTFTENGRYMQWFGGSRMHADSPVTQRLINAGSSTGLPTPTSSPLELSHRTASETVILFVRHESEPYCCLGPVRPLSYQVERPPVTFTFELCFYEALRNSNYFQGIVKMQSA